MQDAKTEGWFYYIMKQPELWNSSISQEQWLSQIVQRNDLVYIKRLSSNDTGLTGGHQSGIYIPESVTRQVCPSIIRTDEQNPDQLLRAEVPSHDVPTKEVRFVYYNDKAFSGSRDEQRITRWKQGVNYTPLQDPEMTGALALFAFLLPAEGGDVVSLSVWVCDSEAEESFIETKLGSILPGESVCQPAHLLFDGVVSLPGAYPVDIDIPEAWLSMFPSGGELIDYVIERFSFSDLGADKRLLKRREMEYAIFLEVEKAHVQETIEAGFASVEEFIQTANSISNRRKARSGRSLEYHLEKIFVEEGLGNVYSAQCITEVNKRPDFIFPGCAEYQDKSYPMEKLAMLAVKTTCKDRWRQIINEADRIKSPYLFTLQEGVSENQFNEMAGESVRLVAPEPLHGKYPEAVRKQLLSLADFIQEIKMLYQ